MDEVKEPNILVALSATVLAALAAECWTASRRVAESTWDSVAEAAGDSSALVAVVLSSPDGVVSSTRGVSLFTSDMMSRRIKI